MKVVKEVREVQKIQIFVTIPFHFRSNHQKVNFISVHLKSLTQISSFKFLKTVEFQKKNKS